MYNFNEDAIREAAYYIWKNNGCKQGTALSDWDAAIHQLSCQAAFATKKSNKTSSSKKATCSATKKTSANTASNKTASTAKSTASSALKSIVLNPISAFKNNSTNAKNYK